VTAKTREMGSERAAVTPAPGGRAALLEEIADGPTISDCAPAGVACNAAVAVRASATDRSRWELICEQLRLPTIGHGG
jgi:hypothetical protein